MMAVSTIKRVKSKSLMKWLKEKVKCLKTIFNSIVLRLLSEYGDEPGMSELLQTEFYKNADELIKLVALDSLSRCSGNKTEQFKKAYFKWEPIFVYSGDILYFIYFFLSSIKRVRIKGLFNIIFTIAESDPSPEVRMMAVSTIKRVKSKSLMKWLKEKVNVSKRSSIVLSLRLLSEYGDEPGMSELLQTEFYKNADELIKLVALDSLSRCSGNKTEQFLKKHILSGSLYSYTAATSFISIMRHPDWQLMSDVIKNAQREMYPTVQLFLDFILRLPVHVRIPENIADELVQLMDSENPFLRQLAVRCYTRTHEKNLLPALLKVAGMDNEKAIRQASFNEALQYVSLNPEELVTVLTYCLPIKGLYSVLYRIFELAPIQDIESFEVLLKKLLGYVEKYREESVRKKSLADLRLMLLLRCRMRKERALFLKLFQRQVWSEEERNVLIRGLNLTDIHAFEELDIDFMADQYNQANVETKIEYLEFFRKLKYRSTVIKKTVFHALETESNNSVLKKINEVINYWVVDSQSSTVAV